MSTQQLMPAKLPVPFVLVTGGKGGVGKTTVCANLGVQLAKSGLRVLMVDLDLGLANLDLVLGLESGSTVEDALQQGVSLGDCVREGPGGVHVLPIWRSSTTWSWATAPRASDPTCWSSRRSPIASCWSRRPT